MPTFLKAGFGNFLPTLWNFPMTPSSHPLLLYGSPSWVGRTGKIVTYITYCAVLQYKDFHFCNRHSCHCVPINRLGTWSPKSCLQSAGEATLPFTAVNAGPALSLHVFFLFSIFILISSFMENKHQPKSVRGCRCEPGELLSMLSRRLWSS